MRTTAIEHSFSLSELNRTANNTEIVERKGIGHPDTICDMLAEQLSRALCRYYLEQFGAVLHHNVDKALLRGGRARARFGGGSIDEPIDIYLAGRAVTEFGGHAVPIEEIAVETVHSWVTEHMHALDPDAHVRVHNLVRQGSVELVELFRRGGQGEVPRANDTSIGVGYAPLSALEKTVHETETHLNARFGSGEASAWGEDVKVMGARTPEGTVLTVACALVDRHVPDMDAYLAEKEALKHAVLDVAASHCGDDVSVAVNAADDPAEGSIYLTVTGTSAEAGDDGEVGRGNRVNGLITPHRPMSLEALAGKNPVTHVGKLYNAAARDIAAALVSERADIAAAECYLLSRIGAPVTEPAVIDIRLTPRDARPVSDFAVWSEEIARDHIGRIPEMVEDFIEGRIAIV